MFKQQFGSMLIYMLLICLVIISIIVIVGAYYSLQETNMHFKRIITDINHKISIDSSFATKPEAKSYLEQLESKSSMILDSSTISYLFQLFTIALVSAGVYLLSESHKNMLKMKRSVKSVVSYITFQNIVRLEMYFSQAHQLSLSIKTDANTNQALIPVLQKRLTMIEDDLENGEKEEVAIESKIIDMFLDDIKYIKENISNPIYGNLQNSCDEIQSLLKDGMFVKRYDQLKKDIKKLFE
jgi:heme/copper-type cytochrome/quinol oxidase subunit 4